jgi:diguanylate cyclase (GGDEF)-like protein
MRILFVEDDELLTQVLVNQLSTQRYIVDVATDGIQGLNYAQATCYDLIVLDVNLPGLDGIHLCQTLRQNHYNGPILLLTANADSSHKVLGLDSGADDYVVKPCTVEELNARIRALLRRPNATVASTLTWGDLILDSGSCEVRYRGQLLHLSPKEYGLLELLLRNPQRVFSSSSILEHLWGFEDMPSEETVRTHIKRLRRKLKAAGAAEIIDNVYGMGYRLKPATETETETVTAPPHDPQSAQDEARLAVIAVWEQFKPPTLERVAILDQAVAALETGSLPEELRLAATDAAHKLTGSLTMFGFPAGSELGSKIERCLEKMTNAEDAATLRSLVSNLHEVLQQTPQAWDDEMTASFSRVVAPQPQPNHVPEVLPEITVLIVDDDPLVLSRLQQFLPRWGIQPITLTNPRDIWKALETADPDLLILDVEMPEINGIELCRYIRQDSLWCGLPILFLTASRNTETVVQLYTAGADDYVAKPFTEPEVVTRIFNRLERNRLLQSLAETDQLTGVANRLRSTRELNRYLSLSQHSGKPVCVAIVDLDHFKQVNDQYGHDVGDLVLKRIASILQQQLRSEDTVARWGGEEFLIGMYGIHKSQALSRLNQVLELVRQETFAVVASTSLKLTFSAGIAEAPIDSTDLHSLYRLADAAMYRAKAAGRNCIMLT